MTMRSLLTYGNATGGARHQRDIAWDFIQRKADDADRRVLRVFITEKGKNAIEQLEQGLEELDENMLTGLSLEEREQARQLLIIMHHRKTDRKGFLACETPNKIFKR